MVTGSNEHSISF